MSSAFFVPGGDPGRFHATRLTAGPWTETAQHGGPPAALLTRAIERLPSTIGGPAQIARLTFDILGPVPVGPVEVAAEVLRPGRAVELVSATLTADERPVVRAQAWRIRSTDLALPDGAVEPGPPPPDRPAEPAEIGSEAMRRGYIGAVEWRMVSGVFGRPGPAKVWTRLRVPVVAGEAPSGLQRAVAVADSGSGVSGMLDFDRWWFINTELTVHVNREPVGEWVYMDARTSLDGGGLGLARTTLADEKGTFGSGAQALLVGPRASAAGVGP